MTKPGDEGVAEESTQEEAQDPAGEAIVEEKGPSEAEVLKSRLEALEAKNAELETRVSAPATTQKPTITSADLRAMSETQREKVAEVYGMSFSDILSNVEANERRQIEDKLTVSQAATNVREALDAECEKDPQVTKLKGHIREFLADIPVADKADEKRLASWMRKAVAYARGQAGVKTTTTTVRTKMETRTPGPGGDDEPVFEKDGGDWGTHSLEDGSKITVEKLISDDKRKAIRHPGRANAIQIPKDFDAPPKFR